MTDLELEYGPCPVKPGSLLRGKYCVTEQLGTGTRGFIFAAEFQRDKAVVGQAPEKIILKVSDSEWEFRNEVWLTRKKFHELVGSPFVHEVFYLQRQTWCVCVMERLGPNLCTAWKGYSKDESRCRDCFRGLLERLRAAHELHLAHLDVKPLNICESADMRSWRLVDWGHAENMALLARRNSGQRGAVCYMSPEMLAGQEWDFSTDLWSAGVVLLEVFLGQVWDEEHWQLFDWPDQCGQDVLDQMETTLGRLPDKIRGSRSEVNESLYGKPETLFSRCPPMLADLLRHLLRYDPAKRATACNALKHIWFAVPDPSSANLQAWLQQSFVKWHSAWTVSDVERTSVDQALQLLSATGDHEVADGWMQKFVDSEFDLSPVSFGALIEAQLKDGVVKRAKRWLDFACSSHMDMGEEMVMRIVQAAGNQYEQVVKTLEDAELPIGPRVYTFMAAIAPEQFRLTEIERVLASMLRYGVVPENEFLLLLFEVYALEIGANNGHQPTRKKSVYAGYHKAVQQSQQSKNRYGTAPLSLRAQMTVRRILFIEPLPPLSTAALHAMYRALGDGAEQILHREPELRERMEQARMRIDEDEKNMLERERIKEEEIRKRQQELNRRREEAQMRAVVRASSAAKASKIAPRNRHCSQRRARSQCSKRRTMSLTDLRPPSKVSPWR